MQLYSMLKAQSLLDCDYHVQMMQHWMCLKILANIPDVSVNDVLEVGCVDERGLEEAVRPGFTQLLLAWRLSLSHSLVMSVDSLQYVNICDRWG